VLWCHRQQANSNRSPPDKSNRVITMRRLMIKRKKKIREEKNVDENSEKEQ
jgi:hypothetical protein